MIFIGLIFKFLILVVFVLICYDDLKCRKIYNKRLLLLIPILVVLSFSTNNIWNFDTFDIGTYLFFVSIFLAAGFLNIIGLGDVKLLMVLMFFLPATLYQNFIMCFLLLGGILAVFQLIILNKLFHKIKLSINGVPYGIPIILSYIYYGLA